MGRPHTSFSAYFLAVRISFCSHTLKVNFSNGARLDGLTFVKQKKTPRLAGADPGVRGNKSTMIGSFLEIMAETHWPTPPSAPVNLRKC